MRMIEYHNRAVTDTHKHLTRLFVDEGLVDSR
jgi:hypothetical protein